MKLSIGSVIKHNGPFGTTEYIVSSYKQLTVKGQPIIENNKPKIILTLDRMDGVKGKNGHQYIPTSFLRSKNSGWVLTETVIEKRVPQEA